MRIPDFPFQICFHKLCQFVSLNSYKDDGFYMLLKSRRWGILYTINVVGCQKNS
jgi:hypothetical protein